jgi:hypothetical protein
MRRAPAMSAPGGGALPPFSIHEKPLTPDAENEEFEAVGGGLPAGWTLRRVDTGAALTVGTAISATTAPTLGNANAQQGRRRSHLAVQPWNRNSGTAVPYALCRALVNPFNVMTAGSGCTFHLRANAILTACGFGSAGGDGALEFMLAADDGSGKADLTKRLGVYLIQDTATPAIQVRTSSYNASSTRTDAWFRAWATPQPLILPINDCLVVGIAPSGQFGVGVMSDNGTLVWSSQSSGTGGAFTTAFGGTSTQMKHVVVTMQSDNGSSPAVGWFEFDYLRKFAWGSLP